MAEAIDTLCLRHPLAVARLMNNESSISTAAIRTRTPFEMPLGSSARGEPTSAGPKRSRPRPGHPSGQRRENGHHNEGSERPAHHASSPLASTLRLKSRRRAPSLARDGGVRIPTRASAERRIILPSANLTCPNASYRYEGFNQGWTRSGQPVRFVHS